MRFKRNKPRPELDDERIVSRFLWLPLTINGETRWLEYANYKIRCFGVGENFESWTASEWIN